MKTAPTDSLYACFRLAAALALATVGGAGVYIGMVALPAYEVDFAVSRGTAAVPFTMVMFGFAVGGIVIGRVVDRYGLVGPMTVSVIAVGLSYGLAARASEFWTFAALHALIGAFGCAAVFTPLVADISKWFTRRRGLAVAICACGSYVAGAIWPLIINPMIETNGWRYTYTMLGVANVAIMLPLLLMLRGRPVGDAHTVAGGGSAGSPQTLRISPMMLVALLSFAGFGCCTAMAVPQVHMVSLCGDRGYGAARGAEMLSLMLAFGIISRLAFGWISDRIGGLRTNPHRLEHAVPRTTHVFARRYADLALYRVGFVRPVPGGHRAELRADRARVVSRSAGRQPPRRRHFREPRRNGVRWLGVRRHLRFHRILYDRIYQRHRLESDQHFNRLVSVVACTPRAHGIAHWRYRGFLTSLASATRICSAVFSTTSRSGGSK